jgi:hypothetical protein
MLFILDASWGDTNQSQPGHTTIDLLSVDFQIGQTREVDVDFKNPEEAESHGLNNDSQGRPDWKDPRWRLDGEEFSVVIRLRGPYIHNSWQGYFRNPGVGQPFAVKIAIASANWAPGLHLLESFPSGNRAQVGDLPHTQARFLGTVERSQCAAPGEVIDPSNEPEVTPVARSIRRVRVKLPLAPAKRLVPPVIVYISVIRATPGVPVSTLVPATVAKMLSPLAAINWPDPAAVPFVRSTVRL